MAHSCWPFKLTLDEEKAPFSDGAAGVHVNLWPPASIAGYFQLTGILG